ncbi:MAG TPA: hypothetical protein VHX37_10230 [Acidobacteriaceae bacterium]|jgi:hypothetical protein|nr:hypothetical protein [Acidobacteriaceae bacterium]
MRVSAVLPALCLTLTLPAAPQARKTPQPPADGSRLYYYATPRSTLETEVHTVPPNDAARFDRLKALFADQGCSGDQLKIQPRGKSHDPGNLVCTWPGTSTSTIIVLAEYQHQGKGQSAVENWSGAVLLPYLYFAMQVRPRENTWVFVESGSKSGADDYIHSLTGEQKKQIRAMIALDSLGVSPVLRFYSLDPEHVYLPAPTAHLQMTLALATLSDRTVPRPQAISPSRWLRTDDTQPFRYSHVPCILLDSIAQEDAGLPGSAHDIPSAIDGNAYFLNYRAIAVFFVGLDPLAAKLPTDSPIWHGQGAQFHIDPNDLPSLR